MVESDIGAFRGLGMKKARFLAFVVFSVLEGTLKTNFFETAESILKSSTMETTTGKKRHRRDDAYQNAYQNITFNPIESTGRPGTPHRYFAESYTVHLASDNRDSLRQQVVHKHANGLAIVTAGKELPCNIESIDFTLEESAVASQSAGSKRKHASKMLKGKAKDDAVSPHDVLANLTMKDKSIQCLSSCVWGTILEINSNLSVQTLCKDPLLDGYLAVILPTGPFPPRQANDSKGAEG